MIRELHFPTPVYILDIKDKNLNTQLEKDIINWMNQDKGIIRTNVQGWHSTTNMHEKPEFKKLTNALYEAQNKIYIEEHLESEPFLGNMWANVNPPGGMNRAHQHPNSLWSGVYYVKAKPNQGGFRIDREDNAQYYLPKNISSPTFFNMTNWIYPSETGMILIFPSWLRHGVLENETNEYRISISFNTVGVN